MFSFEKNACAIYRDTGDSVNVLVAKNFGS